MIDWAMLEKEAVAVRARAYAPYSKYTVGAALLASDGRVFTGANVENASFSLTICAERSAIASAVSAGVRSFVAIAIATGGAKAAAPCGACRQVLAELAPRCDVLSVSDGGDRLETNVADLLPHSFGPGYFKDA